MNYYLYKLIPPRGSFATDMNEAEAAIMHQHIAYWTGVTGKGIAVVFGPVADPAGSWGLAAVEVESEQDVHRLGAEDPAITSGMATYTVYPMPGAISRPHTTS
ncbi:MAG: hypothetical protein JO345_09230 [Streptosporangiaceae bacterium]|nr:hypothetical protein [Streptosporangiaceae bacterium]